MLNRLLTTAGTAAAAAALLLAPSAAARPADASRAPQKRTVGVFDNYFTPTKLTVNRRSLITWRWDETAADVHDLKVTSAPKGFKRFTIDPAAAGFKVSRRLTLPGRYRFLCTFHENDGMEMTITVRR
jgi:plastocyanin